jgi:DNA-binding NarL/FixJ family response regulator
VAEEAQRIFVVCTDLMFSARIREAGALPGAVFEFIGSEEKFDMAIENFNAVLFLCDLHHPKLGSEKAGEMIRKLRASKRGKGAYAIAFGMHTEPEMLKAAEKAGFDKAMPRSLFVKEMPEIVRRAASRIRTAG